MGYPTKKKIRLNGGESNTNKLTFEHLRKKVTPLHHETYNNQLEFKNKLVRSNLGLLSKKVLKHATSRGLAPPEWCMIEKKEVVNNLNSTYFEELIPVSKTISIKDEKEGTVPYSYRNKYEFTIGYTSGEILDADSDVSVGFVSHIDRFEPIIISILNNSNDANNLSKMKDTITLKIINPCIIPIVKKMEKIVKMSSRENDFKVYSRRNRSGIWRLLLIRLSETSKEIMITIQTTNIEKIGIKNELISLLLEEYIEKCDEMNLQGYNIKSIYLHQSDSIVDTFDIGKLDLLYGNPQISFKIRNTELLIGPLSFFQTNTKGCEILYNEIRRIIETRILDHLKKNGNFEMKLVILDVCCGVGAIGLTLLDILCDLEKNFRKVELIGIDCSAEAIESARKNAKIAGFENAKYYSGTAESTLPNLLNNLPSNNSVIAIVDPPRNGLHSSVIKSLRQIKKIESLIYVSCNVESLVKNCLELCSVYDPHTDQKEYIPAFVPNFAIPVDMFPYTKHIETILYLRRSDDTDSHIISEKLRSNNPLLAR